MASPAHVLQLIVQGRDAAVVLLQLALRGHGRTVLVGNHALMLLRAPVTSMPPLVVKTTEKQQLLLLQRAPPLHNVCGACTQACHCERDSHHQCTTQDMQLSTWQWGTFTLGHRVMADK